MRDREMTVTVDQVSADLQFLADTDEAAAIAKRAVEAEEWLAKKYRAIEFLAATGNNEERKAKAEVSEAVKLHVERYLDAVQESAALENKRKTALLRIDVFRTLSANMRQGNV